MKRVTILGSTGSIGKNTLDVLSHHQDAFSVYALTTNSQIDLLVSQCVEFSPEFAVVADENYLRALREKLSQVGSSTKVLAGRQALSEVSSETSVDIVMAAIVGAAGLEPTLSAVRSGKRVLLANKEALVMSGQLFIDAVRESGAELLPIDSEHNAIFQCLPVNFKNLTESGVRKILLTGSGGPFRKWSKGDLKRVTPEDAVKHPNWSMGKKISVDSATMINKGLEYIEAYWLFSAQPEQLQIVVHPQSVVHSMVEYIDGSIIAQLGQPDMRTPIANCLGWPTRIDSGVTPLNFLQMGDLTFEAPDFDRFPCLKYALDAISFGGTFPIALNAANEVAVDAFLNGSLPYLDIARIIGNVMESWDSSEPDTIEAVINADEVARSMAESQIERCAGAKIVF